MKFKVLPTERRRHAVEIMQNLDINSTDGIIVCGGDGLVHEVITGYFLHPDQEGLHKKVKVGITPCGRPMRWPTPCTPTPTSRSSRSSAAPRWRLLRETPARST